MTKTFAGSRKCPICGCSVMIQQRAGVKKSLMSALGLVSHLQALHPSVAR